MKRFEPLDYEGKSWYAQNQERRRLREEARNARIPDAPPGWKPKIKVRLRDRFAAFLHWIAESLELSQ